MVETPVIEDLQPWQRLEQLVDAQDVEELKVYWRSLGSGELARAVSRLDEAAHEKLLTLLPPEDAADLVDDLSFMQAADMIEELDAPQAALIVAEMESDDQVDLLAELDDDEAAAIMEHLSTEDAEDLRKLAQYGPDTAGGIMITEYLVYRHDQTVEDVVADLRQNHEEYAHYDVQYIYVTQGEDGPLRGVVKMKSLVMAPGRTLLVARLEQDIQRVSVHDTLDQLDEFFDGQPFYAIPVVDDDGRMVGVVRRAHLREAIHARSDKTMLRLGGIVMGDEIRTMPLLPRSFKRLSFLFPTMLLGLVSVSVVAAFEDTVDKAPALAIFMPLVAGLCGAAGNQALAVSMRELALGLVTPADVLRVLRKELPLGLIAGVLLGISVFGIAMLMRGNPWLGLVAGAAIPVTMTMSVIVGGTIPLILKKLRVDPAMASGPFVTTTVDLFGFFTVLGLATVVIERLM